MFEDTILSLTVGVVAGFMAGMLGLGGGFLVVPYLNLVLGLPMHKAVGTSLLVRFFTAVSASLTYIHQKKIDYKLGLIIIVAVVPGAFLGAYLTQFIGSNVLRIIFGLLVLFTSLNMLFKIKFKVWKLHGFKNFWGNKNWKRVIYDGEKKFEYFVNPFPVLVGTFMVGVMAGMLGIGGGGLQVPFLTLMIGVPIHVSIATTIFTMIFSSTSGSIEHVMLGNIVFSLVVLLGIGVTVGSYVGAKVSRKIPATTMRKIFGVVLLLIALRMLLIF